MPLRLAPDILGEVADQSDQLSTTYHFVADFQDISADDFVLDTRIVHTYHERWAVCQIAGIYILGTKGALIIPFSIPGCVSDLGLMLNDVYLSGKKHDLSAFGVDLSIARDIAVKNSNQHISVYVDGVKVFDMAYHEPVGRFCWSAVSLYRSRRSRTPPIDRRRGRGGVASGIAFV